MEAPGARAREVPDPRGPGVGTGGASGPVEVLPAVLCIGCIGVFRSTAVDPGLDPVMHRSALVLPWFRDAAVVPSGGDADPALRGIDWDAPALDHEL
ncbi:hypothetical protein HLK56_21400 [Streptomyces sp. G9]|uniref:hypothetical protein n=1 Tax=Streptomyces sp. G9 TaxID=1684483 RepID=UPI003D70854A